MKQLIAVIAITTIFWIVFFLYLKPIVRWILSYV
jgi:hypothetical protein